MRFFIERGEIADGAVTLSAEDSAHIGRVLRRRVGDSLSLCDGQGMDYEGVILATGPAVTTVVPAASKACRDAASTGTSMSNSGTTMPMSSLRQ